MTTDELVTLTRALVGHLSVRNAVAEWSDLEDIELALLVRFVAGERPSGTELPREPLRRLETNTGASHEAEEQGEEYDVHQGNRIGDIRLL